MAVRIVYDHGMQTNGSRKQPYSTYALHIATFTSLSFVFDPLILFLCYKATKPMSSSLLIDQSSLSESSTLHFTLQSRALILTLQLSFMLFSKFIKLASLYLHNPADLLFLPASVAFGYFHGLIKLYALFTLRMVRLLTSYFPFSLQSPPPLSYLTSQTPLPPQKTTLTPSPPPPRHHGAPAPTATPTTPTA